MKHLLLTFFLVLALVAVKAQSSPPSADQIMEEARKQADKEHKNVFVMFHASWCGWCHRMDNSMNDEACKKFFTDNYVIRHLVVDESADKLNLENPGAKEFRTKYYGDGQGIPYWLIFDKNGKLLSDCKMREKDGAPDSGNNIGCPSSEKEVAYFLDILSKTSGLNTAQLEIIRKRFRENDK